MKIAKKLLVTFMCVLVMISACTLFASAAKAVTKAQPKVKETTSSSVILTWEKVKNADGYRVFKQVDGKWKKLSDTKKVSYTAKDLIASSTYKFAVRHYTVKNGEKVLGKAYGTVTAKTKALSKARNFTASIGEDGIALKWDKLPGASGYRIYLKNAEGEWKALKTLSASKTSYTAELDSNFNKYTFGIKAYAKTAKGTVWASSYATCKTALSASGKAEIVSAVSAVDSITLTWNKVEGADGYRVYSYKNGEYSVIDRTYGGENTSCTVVGLNSGSAYTFAIKAFSKKDGKTAFALLGDKYTAYTAKANLDVYRAEMISEILGGNELYIEYSEQHPTYGKVDSVLALRMGKIYLKETVNGASTAYIYNTETGNVTVLDVNNKKYRTAAESEELHILLAALREIFTAEKMGEVKAEYKNGLICESFTEAKYGRYMEFYFTGEDTLSAIYTKYADGSESAITVSKLSDSADASLFDIPLDYTKA
ncbi:MAG: fibronectin type III domain-containing protein [Clostridia bacterium]|nr:fibronectin type III domain-containing protein [Clostridia bacterium]